MTLYEELKARGLVAQITDEEIIDLINNGKATFYSSKTFPSVNSRDAIRTGSR